MKNNRVVLKCVLPESITYLCFLPERYTFDQFRIFAKIRNCPKLWRKSQKGHPNNTDTRHISTNLMLIDQLRLSARCK